MKKAAILILLLCLMALSPAVLAECAGGKASILAPAVIEEKGQLLRLSLETRPGNGEIYISADTLVGIETQGSQRTAAAVANALLGTDAEECDYFFRVESMDQSAQAVDGPSAGGAMGLLALAVLSGEELRPGVTATGTIEPDGSIGEVGSVHAKARAAAEGGHWLFLVPRLTVYERLLLSSVKKTHNITVVEVRTLAEAAAIAFSDVVPRERDISYVQTVVPEGLPPSRLFPQERFAHFAWIAGQTQKNAERKVAGALANGDGSFDEYFMGELNASRALLEKGYYYSAANLAFLTQIGADVLAKQPTEEEAYRTRAEVIACMESAQRPRLTEGNYEEVFGGDLRMAWARRKLAEADMIEIDGEDAAIFVLNELAYAQGWCTLGAQLYAAPGGGRELDETRLQMLASEKVSDAHVAASAVGDADALWHAEAAQEEYALGRYGAAIYDAAYAAGTSLAHQETEIAKMSELRERVGGMNNATVSGLWPALYQGQSVFYASGEDADLFSAYRLAAFVQELERSGLEMGVVLMKEGADTGEENGNDQAAPEAPAQVVLDPQAMALVTLLVLGAVFVLGYEAAMVLLERRKGKQ